MLSDVSSSRPGGADTSRWGIALSSYAVMPLHIWEMEHTDCIEKKEDREKLTESEAAP